ncbi:MAG: hypothetical protein ABF289_13570 [Clostridiales bacterium]
MVLEIIISVLTRIAISKDEYYLTLLGLSFFVVNFTITNLVVMVMILNNVFKEIYLYMIFGVLIVNIFVILKALFIKKQIFLKENKDTNDKEINTKTTLPFAIFGILIGNFIIEHCSSSIEWKILGLIMVLLYLLFETIFIYALTLLFYKHVNGDKSWYNNLRNDKNKKAKI